MRRELFEFLRKNGNIRPLDAQSRKIIIEYVDSNLLMTSLVPIQIHGLQKSNSEKITSIIN